MLSRQQPQFVLQPLEIAPFLFKLSVVELLFAVLQILTASILRLRFPMTTA